MLFQNEILAVPECLQTFGTFGGLSAHERETMAGSFQSSNLIIFFDSKTKEDISRIFDVSLDGKLLLHEEWNLGM